MSRRERIAAVGLALLVALCAAAVASAGSGEMVLVSEHGEVEGEEIAAEVPAISGDGRYVAYVRSVFLQGDSIFLAQPGGGPPVAVDIPKGMSEGNHLDAGSPSLSGDGRYLAFASEDPGLSTEDKDYSHSAACTCAVRDIFVYDRVRRSITLVSRRTGVHGAAADDDSNLPSISADGQYVAFGTEANNLKRGLYGGVWLRDIHNSTMTLVSGGRIGGFEPSVSRHGETVAYTFTARSHPHVNQIGIGHPRKGQGRAIASRASGRHGAPADDDAQEPSISANGRYVAFSSEARNLSSADLNSVEDVFVRDLKTGRTILVSRASGPHGAAGQGDSSHPSISANGRYVAFQSYSNNLGPHDDGRVPDVFVRDMRSGRVSLVSTTAGAAADGPSGDPAISADGRYVAFDSKAANLSPTDPDHVVAVFRYQLLP